MNFLKKLFYKPKVDCPRCLGKGNVDWDDIKRLNKELVWKPGKCAYCDGLGQVNAEMVSKVPADYTYLTIEILQDERRRLINADEAALWRGDEFEKQITDFISQVEHLHFTGHVETAQIVELFLIPKRSLEISLEERTALMDYIDRIIENKKANRN